MSIPRFYELMWPVLELIGARAEGEALYGRDLGLTVGRQLGVSGEDLEAVYAGRDQNIINHRAAWAVTYMVQAGLLTRPRRGFVAITARGRQALALQVRPEDMRDYLERFPEYRSFRERRREPRKHGGGSAAAAGGGAELAVTSEPLTPDELLTMAQEELSDTLAAELLTRLRQVEPRRFEQIIIDLMERMGYGVGALTPRSHDGGIDGIIDQDELGLDKIYIQAKRYDAGSRVQALEMQNFVGALAIKPVTRGVFVTTSDFADSARDVAHDAQGKNIILIDGERLAQLLIRHDVGVQVRSTIIIKKIDEDYFE